MIRPILRGLATWTVPGYLRRVMATGGSDSARYCHTVWFRHLLRAMGSGMPFPSILAELGPGDSIGMGLCALLTGVQKYIALDAVQHADLSRNLATFDELVELISSRAVPAGDEEFPNVKPRLDAYRFPSDLLDPDRLAAALAPERVAMLRRSIAHPAGEGSPILYLAPWSSRTPPSATPIDFAVSQAVMEHVDDVAATYSALHDWLAPGGWMSHQIDFRCHGTAETWNGHWTYSPLSWRLIKGARPYLLNRLPWSSHRRAIDQAGFTMVATTPVESANVITRGSLAHSHRTLVEDGDMTISGMHLIARKT